MFLTSHSVNFSFYSGTTGVQQKEAVMSGSVVQTEPLEAHGKSDPEKTRKVSDEASSVS